MAFTRQQFDGAMAGILANAKHVVGMLERMDGRYYEQLDGGQADVLRDWTHKAHKWAVQVAREFQS